MTLCFRSNPRGVVRLLIAAVGVISLLTGGCSFSRRPVLTEDKRWIVSGLDRGLPAVPEVPPAGLDYNALYVRQQPPGRRETSFEYIRFWPNGRAIYRTAWGIRAHAFNGDNFSGGLVARWGADGHHLVVQTLNPGQPWEGAFVTRRAEVVDDGDRLLFHHKQSEGAWAVDTRDDAVFIRQPVPGMIRQPDW